MKKHLILLPTLLLCLSLAGFAKEESQVFSKFLVGRDLPTELTALENRGEITKAIEYIDKIKDEKLVNERERLQRIKRDYEMTAPMMLEKLKKDLPDVTLEDIERWTAAKQFQTETVDGVLRYFRREPSNLWRHCPEAKKRRAAFVAKNKTQTVDGDVAENLSRREVINRIVNKGDRQRRYFHVKHVITLNGGVVPKGETISCWMPIPQEYNQQTGPENLQTVPEMNNYDKNTTAAQRTLYMERSSNGDAPTVFRAEYDYSMEPFYVKDLDPNKIKYDANDLQYIENIKEKLPHIILNDEVTSMAKSIVGETTNPLIQASKLWHWMQNKENIRYVAEMEYSIIPSTTGKILATRTGDCGVQASLFISMCRSLGVPARWQSGWVNMPNAWNMHDWAEIYMPPYGWLPVDPSIGYIDSKDKKIHDYLFCGMEPYRMIANTDIHVDFVPPTKFLRSDPVDNQVGELQWSGGNIFYPQWSYDVTVDEIKKENK